MTEQENLSAWIEWREKCLLADCSEPVQAALNIWAKKIAHSTWSGTLTQQLEWAWHLFETSLVAAGAARAKEPKFKMFEVAATNPDEIIRLRVLESYAGKVLFSALRDVAVQETWGRRGSRGRFESIPVVRVTVPGVPSLEDILPDPRYRGLQPDTAAEDKNLNEIAAAEAQAFFEKLSNPARAGLGAYFSFPKKPLADHAVHTLAGCQTSGIDEAKKKAAQHFAKALANKYASDNDSDTVRRLQALALRHLGELCARLFDAGKPPTQ